MARVFTWTPPVGSPVTLNDRNAGYRLMQSGTVGLSAPPYRVTDDTYAGVDGTTLQALDADRRDIMLGLQVEGPDVATFRTRWRTLIRSFRPKAGDGTLTVADEWGMTRTLTCRYVGGLEGDGDAEFAGTVGRAAVKLAAFDPWWYGDQQTPSIGLGAPVPFFPIPPVNLSPSAVQGQFLVDLSDSDSETYPVWTITGPGSGLVLANLTTGRSISVTVDLTEGQSMIIDTRRGFQSVRLDDGTNLAGAVQGDPSLWPLIDDVNQVSAVLTGATANSRIVGSYRARYSGI